MCNEGLHIIFYSSLVKDTVTLFPSVEAFIIISEWVLLINFKSGPPEKTVASLFLGT